MLGAPAGSFPRIVVASGSVLSHLRARFSGSLVVFVPKGERNRASIRREVHRAAASAMLECVRKGNPERFAAVAGAMDASFRETNRLLLQTLSAEGKADMAVLSLQICAFGYVPALGRFRDNPERLGIAGYGDNARRRSWEDEAVSLLADVQGKGWAKVAETQAEASKNARRTEKAAMKRYLETRSLFDRFTGKRRQMRKRLIQAGNARTLCEEAERKTAMLHSALGGAS